MRWPRFIDHTVLKQTTTRADVQTVCAEATQYGFAAVCIPPVYVADAMGFLKSSGGKSVYRYWVSRLGITQFP